MNKIKICFVISMLAATSSPAQNSSGTSGPDNSSYTRSNPVSTNTTVVTHAMIRSALNDCLGNELLKIVRVLAKSNSLQVAASDLTQGGAEFGIYRLFFDDEFSHLEYQNVFRSIDGGKRIAVQINFEQITVPTNIFTTIKVQALEGSLPFSVLDLKIKGSDDLPYLNVVESPLADAFDEYGIVDTQRVVATQLRWKVLPAGQQQNLPVVLNQKLPLRNFGFAQGDKSPVVKGVTFDLGSYSSCINTRLGVQVKP